MRARKQNLRPFPSRFPLALLLLLGAATTACATDQDLAGYQSDYSRHEPLHVVGYP
ncbi:hypothetical protein ABR738_15745 [Streptomyces sp. Edi4]|uniref:hypothetical protein n=1 Tax=Streptomyces sp. Edi4 TaxID=3162527 RepID=UPI003305ADD3